MKVGTSIWTALATATKAHVFVVTLERNEREPLPSGPIPALHLLWFSAFKDGFAVLFNLDVFLSELSHFLSSDEMASFQLCYLSAVLQRRGILRTVGIEICVEKIDLEISYCSSHAVSEPCLQGFVAEGVWAYLQRVTPTFEALLVIHSNPFPTRDLQWQHSPLEITGGSRARS